MPPMYRAVYPLSGRRSARVVADDERQGPDDVKAARRLADLGPAPRAWCDLLAHVLGGEEERERAVRDLAGELQVLRADRGDVHRKCSTYRVDGELERLPGAVGQRKLSSVRRR